MRTDGRAAPFFRDPQDTRPRTAAVGALLALLVIGGAIFTHLTSLGIVVADDGGLLFGLAVTVAVLSAVVLAIWWRQLPFVPKPYR